MDFDFDKILRIKEIRLAKSKLSEEENCLSEPIMKDRAQIKVVKDIFTDILSEVGCPVYGTTVINRKKLIFVILYLFSPSVLAGGKMPRGLREDICEALELHAKSIVSNNFSDIIFLYDHYSDFKKDVEYLFNQIVTRLNDRGLAI